METFKCTVCVSEQYEERRIDYLYSHQNQYLLVPNTPIEVCLDCGMVYFEAKVLKEIERHFFAIQQKTEEPDHYVRMPTKAFS